MRSQEASNDLLFESNDNEDKVEEANHETIMNINYN